MGDPRRLSTTELNTRLTNKVQTKVLSTDPALGTIAELTWNSLTIGNWYEVFLQVAIDRNSEPIGCGIDIIHNGSVLGSVILTNRQGGGTLDQGAITAGTKVKFQATATTVTFLNVGNTAAVRGDGTQEETFTQIEERNDLEPTTDFT